LLQAAIDAACGSSALTCTLVVGSGAAQLLAAVDTRRCRVAINPKWKTGLASSLRCGLRAHPGDDACIIMLGDQPLVTSADLDKLIDVWSVRMHPTAQRAREPAPIVALQAGDIWGAPVLFPRRDFAALLRLRGDAGAKRHAAQHLDRLAFVDALDARAFHDVDTPEDLTRLNGRGTRRIRR
jgi:molybdenum cofactor cytidylyltransferase